jgi:hypothetical protein
VYNAGNVQIDIGIASDSAVSRNLVPLSLVASGVRPNKRFKHTVVKVQNSCLGSLPARAGRPGW